MIGTLGNGFKCHSNDQQDLKSRKKQTVPTFTKVTPTLETHCKLKRLLRLFLPSCSILRRGGRSCHWLPLVRHRSFRLRVQVMVAPSSVGRLTARRGALHAIERKRNMGAPERVPGANAVRAWTSNCMFLCSLHTGNYWFHSEKSQFGKKCWSQSIEKHYQSVAA